ncbi:hypothetical protein MKW94_002431 [Papaver nudicaule]|uniref:TF-B3 domain-containing protein n=1 Tax=Papaver nudicaule TaxID=74823 RepID=A0AA41V2Y6_PAPNU|nr:hypothetical protein [Papaver nudicaule]
MQRGFKENEIRLKNSPPSSPNSTSSSSNNSSSSDHSAAARLNFSIPQFPSGFVGDEFIIQEKNCRNFGECGGDYERRIIHGDNVDDRRKFLKSTVPIPVQNFISSVPPPATDSFSRNFLQNNAMLQSQLGTIGGRDELTPILPKVDISWGQQTVEDPCEYYIPYNDISLSGNATPSLKRKAEVSTNSCNPTQMESLFGQFTSGSSKDSGSSCQVLQSGFEPVQALPQSPFLPMTVRSQPVNYSSTPPLNLEATEKQEMDFFAKPWSQWSENSIGGNDASVPVNNRKVVRPRFSSSMSMAVISDESRNANSGPSAKNEYPLFPLESFPAYHHPTSNSHRPEAEEETAIKGFVLLVQKELRNTDVGNLGRIVIPKKDAEANLPPLEAKDGIMLQMEDMNSSHEWKFKYRYWPNNKSRMYVMENTGDFVKTHNLQTGDLFIVYKEENSGKYIVRGKKGTRPVYAGDSVELRSTVEMRNHGRVAEGRELATAHGQLMLEPGYATPGDFFFDLNAGQDMIAPGIPFEFQANNGGFPKSHFSPGPLLNLQNDVP